MPIARRSPKIHRRRAENSLVPGPALPVAYLPGATGRTSLWYPIAARLAGRRPPIFCEYPGFGGFPREVGVRSLSDLFARLVSRLPERFDLVSMSMGGVLALRLAVEHPERVRRLVLVATSGGVDVQQLGALDFRDTLLASHPDLPRWFVDDHTDLTAHLAEVKSPTLLIFGDHDLIAPVAVGEFLCSMLPDARLEVLPEATHDLQEEFPDLLASLIEAHLRRA